ncbi:MAG TPA: trypsin-like peptidase domain-containing protein [Burkholderiaceae bacterium]|nr:trypsin-like peptidase domain-containing protein [Burkholderiaceae bacterium]
MRSSLRWLGLLGALLLAAPAHAALDPAAWIRLAASVLKVEVIRMQGGYSLGSGVVVEGGRVVTNCHVTRDAQQIAVLQRGLRLPAQTQQVDAFHDLCVLHVRGLDAALAVPLAPATQLTIGQPLTAIGHTAGALQRSDGEVLALHRMDGARVIQSSNYFNSGASGGGLFDADAHLVGVLSFRLRGGAAHYFAVPSEWLATQLRDASRGEPIGPLGAGALAFWERPLDTQPLFLRAAVLERDGDWNALQPLATDWLRRADGDPEPWYLLGVALDRQGRGAEARHAFECSLATPPGDPRARAELKRVASPDPDTSPDADAPPDAAACHL